MKELCARDIMHPRMSLPAKTAGPELIERLLGVYPALPVVQKRKLVGVIARKNLMTALVEKGVWPEHEFQKRL